MILKFLRTLFFMLRYAGWMKFESNDERFWRESSIFFREVALISLVSVFWATLD